MTVATEDPPVLVERRRGGERRQFPRGGRRHDDPCIVNAVERVKLAISEQLDAQIRRHNLSYSRCARNAGVSEQGLSDILKTTTDPKMSTLVTLARSLGCELFVELCPRRSQPQ
jgi:DNA-binding phage protein